MWRLANFCAKFVINFELIFLSKKKKIMQFTGKFYKSKLLTSFKAEIRLPLDGAAKRE